MNREESIATLLGKDELTLDPRNAGRFIRYSRQPGSCYTWVYLILDHATNWIKIGRADNPNVRLLQLCHEPTLHPRPHDYELLEAFLCETAMERDLHKWLDHCRKRGEWFDISDAELEELMYGSFFNCPRWSGLPSLHICHLIAERQFLIEQPLDDVMEYRSAIKSEHVALCF